MLQRRTVLSLPVLGAWSLSAWGQTFPARPITVTVPVPAGGGTDTLARTVGQPLSAALGQPVVVDNRPGAGGNIGAEYVMRAKPDGHTLLLTPATIAMNVAAYEKLPYDLGRDFQAITLIGNTPSVVIVSNKLPATTVQEFVALARSNPGSLNYGSAGLGSAHQLHSEFFNQLIGARSNHIPYKGQAPAMNDLIGGQIDYLFAPLQNSLPHIQAGRVRALAVTAARRSSFLPDTPTLIELGYQGTDLVHWFALIAPAATPKPVVDTLYDALAKIAATPAMRDKLTSMGFEMQFDTPQRSQAFMLAELDRWAKLARQAGITPQ